MRPPFFVVGWNSEALVVVGIFAIEKEGKSLAVQKIS